MTKIEKIRKALNESYCQECKEFGLCEYCELKQTLVDIEDVLKGLSDVKHFPTQAYNRLVQEGKENEKE